MPNPCGPGCAAPKPNPCGPGPGCAAPKPNPCGPGPGCAAPRPNPCGPRWAMPGCAPGCAPKGACALTIPVVPIPAKRIPASASVRILFIAASLCRCCRELFYFIGSLSRTFKNASFPPIQRPASELFQKSLMYRRERHTAKNASFPPILHVFRFFRDYFPFSARQ